MEHGNGRDSTPRKLNKVCGNVAAYIRVETIKYLPHHMLFQKYWFSSRCNIFIITCIRCNNELYNK